MRLPGPVRVAARWLLALVAPAAALALALLMRPLIDQVPSPPFLAGVLLVAWLGGFRLALLSTVLAALALDWFFIPPVHTIGVEPSEVLWVSLFVGVCAVVAWLVANRAQARERVLRGAEIGRAHV